MGQHGAQTPRRGGGRAIRTLLLLLALAVLVPLVLLQGGTLSIQARADLRQASESALALAEVTAAYSQTVVGETHALLLQLAERPGVRQSRPGNCDPLLAELAALNPRYANVLVADPHGNVLCSVVALRTGALPNASEMRWVHEALASTGPSVGSPHVGRITGVWVSVQALALRDAEGRPYAVLGVPLDLAALRPALQREALEPERAVKIFNSEGVVIARQPEGERWVGRNLGHTSLVQTVLREQHGYTRLRGPSGVEKVYAYAPVPGTNWYAVAAIPSSEVFAPVWRDARRHAVIAIGVIGLAIILALLSARRIVRPVRAIGDAANRVAEGDLATRAAVEGPREIAQVAVQFNDMLARRAQAEAAQARLTRMLEAVREVQQSYIADAPAQQMFKRLLDAVLEQSGSGMGFVGEVLETVPGRPYLQVHAVSDLMQGGGTEMRFDDLDTLFERVIQSAAPVLVNALVPQDRLPPGRPPIRAFLGLPLHRHDRVVGVVGLANRPGGYTHEMIAEMEPLLVTCAHIVEAYASDKRRREVEEQLAFLAQYDSLTGLPNRVLLRDRLALGLTRAAREQCLLAVLVIDLDHFKLVNESLGRSVGDAYLRAVAARLRAVDADVVTVARLESDNFAAVLEDMRQVEELVDAVQRYQQALGEPVRVDGRDIAVTVSIGVSVFPHDGQDSEALLERADTAMVQAKREGRNAYRFFTPAMQVQAVERLSAEARLRGALQRGELLLHYQPQIDLVSGRVVGVEALVRWSSEGRLLLPSDFVPLAEQNGLILPIGEWVLRSACAQVAEWKRRGIAPLVVSVNVSPFQFRHADIPALVTRTLSETGLSPQHLEIEITENVLLDEPEVAVAALQALRRAGVSLAIDDFGTGYSSLAYLKRLPVQKVKIDRAFVHELTTDPDDEAIVTAIIAMARNLHLTVIAEGVETAEQLALLKLLKCDQYQGYYYSRPVPPDVFEETMHRDVGKGVG